MGVSISVFNLISKIFNVPLLNITTSFVAEDASEGLPDISSESSRSSSNPLLSPSSKFVSLLLVCLRSCVVNFTPHQNGKLHVPDRFTLACPLLSDQDADTYTEVSVSKKEEDKVFLPAVSSALVLGTALGVGQACVLGLLAGPVLTVMGVGAVSNVIGLCREIQN